MNYKMVCPKCHDFIDIGEVTPQQEKEVTCTCGFEFKVTAIAPGIVIATESKPGKVKKAREYVSDLDRSEIPLAVLLACPCKGCIEEVVRRATCDAPTKPDCGVGFAEGEPLLKQKDERVPSVPEIMAEAAKTFKERNELYGDSYKHFHEVMQVLFPDGLLLRTDDEWRRFGILFYLIGKVVRYCNNFRTGGHIDSAHDAGVYAFMLEEVSRMGLKERGQ